MRPALLVLISGLAACATDPANLRPSERRELECQYMAEPEVLRRFPGRTPPPPNREVVGGRADFLVCARRVLALDDRRPREDRLLQNLTETVSAMAEVAVGAESDPQTRWHVDAFDPSMAVAVKLAQATRVALFERGRQVSDRVPLLAAGDVAVLTKLPVHEAQVLACKRAFTLESLKPGEVLLRVGVIDSRETVVHAGLCRQGDWRWLL